MRVIIQRVSSAKVNVNNKIVGKIASGLLVFVGITNEDSMEDINWLANKIINLRIFSDDNNLMNKTLIEIKGNILLVSQFTLYAQTKKGNRPSFCLSAQPIVAIPLYNSLINKFNELLPKPIETGIFGAAMKVNLCNDGPVTIIIDTKNKDL